LEVSANENPTTPSRGQTALAREKLAGRDMAPECHEYFNSVLFSLVAAIPQRLAVWPRGMHR
jgi:hypothetical protein